MFRHTAGHCRVTLSARVRAGQRSAALDTTKTKEGEAHLLAQAGLNLPLTRRHRLFHLSNPILLKNASSLAKRGAHLLAQARLHLSLPCSHCLLHLSPEVRQPPLQPLLVGRRGLQVAAQPAQLRLQRLQAAEQDVRA